ncbi:MAG: hypothetical protein KDC26_04095 [Armatimonadetes bacterium]|nr:hypothetical protein [Armatimonadota bacterium]
MPDERLFRLYKLHNVDESLYDIKKRAQNLDTGQEELALMKQIEKEGKSALDKYESLHRQITESENKLAETKNKVTKYESQLYDGSISSSREVENMQQEIKMLKELAEKTETRLSGLNEEFGPAKEEAQKVARSLKKLKKVIIGKRDEAKAEAEELKVKYREIASTREERLNNVEPELIRAYDAARKQTGSTGMATVESEEHKCSACGNNVADRMLQQIREGKTILCEDCRRILFIVMPGVE